MPGAIGMDIISMVRQSVEQADLRNLHLIGLRS